MPSWGLNFFVPTRKFLLNYPYISMSKKKTENGIRKTESIFKKRKTENGKRKVFLENGRRKTENGRSKKTEKTENGNGKRKISKNFQFY